MPYLLSYLVHHLHNVYFISPYHLSSALSSCRSEGSIRYAPIMTSNRPSHSYSLNGITAPVLYKLVHYFMENPIHGDTVLQYPLEEEVSGR